MSKSNVTYITEKKRNQILACGKCDCDRWYLCADTLEVQCHRCGYVPDDVTITDSREETSSEY